MTTESSTPTNAAGLTPADIVTTIRATALAPADRVEILRALRETMPDIVPPDPQQKTRITFAKGVPRQFVDAAINGLTASDVWQQSAATTSAEVGAHRDFEEQRPVYDELKTFSDILRYSLNYHHWQATKKSRAAYRVGKQLGGDGGLVLQPHIDIMAATLPKRSRKPKPPASKTPPMTTPPAETPAPSKPAAQ
ncbi:MAG TPA: hypothetical protein VF713_15045 [Thermoanaerobaculia bacterium]